MDVAELQAGRLMPPEGSLPESAKASGRHQRLNLTRISPLRMARRYPAGPGG